MNRDSQNPPGISTRGAEIVVSLAMLAIGALAVFDGLRLGAGWTDGNLQPGYFPFHVGSILFVCALVLLGKAAIGKVGGPKVFVAREARHRVLRVIVPAALFVVAIQLIGVYVAAAVYVGMVMRSLGRYALSWSLVLGVCLMTLCFLVFEVWFALPLHKGLWNPLFWVAR